MKNEMNIYEQNYMNTNKCVSELAFMSKDFSYFQTSIKNKKGLSGYTMDWKYVYFWDDRKIWKFDVHDMITDCQM